MSSFTACVSFLNSSHPWSDSIRCWTQVFQRNARFSEGAEPVPKLGAANLDLEKVYDFLWATWPVDLFLCGWPLRMCMMCFVFLEISWAFACLVKVLGMRGIAVCGHVCCLTCPERVRGDCMSNLCTVFFCTKPRHVKLCPGHGAQHFASRYWYNFESWRDVSPAYLEKTQSGARRHPGKDGFCWEWASRGEGNGISMAWHAGGCHMLWLFIVGLVSLVHGPQVAAKLVPRCFKQIVSKSHGPKVYRVACDAECWRLFSSAVVCEFENVSLCTSTYFCLPFLAIRRLPISPFELSKCFNFQRLI